MNSLKSVSAVIVFSLASIATMANAQQRAPQGFLFHCNNGECPSGAYQDKCPQCFDINYDSGSSSLSCYCFNSDKRLQGGSTVRSSQNCASIDTDASGTLVCTSKSGLRKGKKGKKGKAKAVPTEAPFAATNAPTAGKNLVNVDFNFNCVEGDCPTGSYQTFCPRCDVNTDSTPPNDPRPSISCQCFDGNGQMTLGTSTMWNFQLCPKIVTSFGGKLGCVGAGKAQGIYVYGGRRELSAQVEEVDAEIREEDALGFKA